MKYYIVIGICLSIISFNVLVSTKSITGSCGDQEFKCKNGQCIDEDLLCDGAADCLDKSDEVSRICSTITCPGNTFACKYGACISKIHKCNGIQNCVDNSDEEHCTTKNMLSKLETPTDSVPLGFKLGKRKYVCQSGEIIDDELICDGEPHCTDHSDETQELCYNFHCPYFTFRCSYGACISLTKKCNGIKDCNDGSDEKVCNSSSKPSKTTPKPITKSFQCNSGEIIDEECLCDGETDCADGSDETLKECSQFHCPSFTYKCNYGACVPFGAKCNGMQECADNSDEASCSELSPTHVVVKEKYKCKSGHTIDADKVCDGQADCEDASDETLNICLHINCPHFAYRCNYGACVHGTAKCNGIKECIDNSDELCTINNSTSTKHKEPFKDYLIFT